MSRLSNSFEGGTDGTTITPGNSGGTSGDAFSGVQSAGATVAFSSANPAHGTLGAHVATTTSAAAYVQHSMAAAVNQIWVRGYFYLPALPVSGTWPLFRWVSAGGSTLCGSVEVNSSGQLLAKNTAGSTIGTMPTATVPTGQQFRIEATLLGSVTVGQVEIKQFTSAEAVTPTDTYTSAASQNTGAQPQLIRYGVGSSTASVDYYLDTIAADDTGYIGAFAPNNTVWSYGYNLTIGA